MPRAAFAPQRAGSFSGVAFALSLWSVGCSGTNADPDSGRTGMDASDEVSIVDAPTESHAEASPTDAGLDSRPPMEAGKDASIEGGAVRDGAGDPLDGADPADSGWGADAALDVGGEAGGDAGDDARGALDVEQPLDSGDDAEEPAESGVDAGVDSGQGGALDAAPDGRGETGADASPGPSKALRVYVAGESIEQRNRFAEPPFLSNGALNTRGGGSLLNDDDEYGWMVPLADRVRLRAPDLSLEFVGTEPWTDSNGDTYKGVYPATPGYSSAIAGTDIASWLDQRRAELVQRTHCYDIAFASRGGNDLNQDMTDEYYEEQLTELIGLLLKGSSCRADPLVFVTAHLPDRTEVSVMDSGFQGRTASGVAAYKNNPALPADERARVFMIDVYSAFRSNRPTTSMPSPTWFAPSTGFDMDTIGHIGDPGHPRRLASIYAGEVTADLLDLAALRARAR